MTGSDITLPELSVRLAALPGTGTKVAITSHIRPDGDAIGATLGLYHLLTDHGIDASIVGLGPIPDRYKFLTQTIDLHRPDQLDPAHFGYLIVLDTGSIDRAPEFVPAWTTRVPTINIDHHPTNTKFGTSNCVLPKASAVAEIITQMADHADWQISAAAATALWVGIITDTGRFAYSCTTSATLQAAALVLASGINTPEIDQRVFQSTSAGALRLQARAINNMQLLQNERVAIITLAQQDFHECGASTEDAEEIINLPRRLDSVEIALAMTEMAESTPENPRTKASFRTKPPFDAGSFCQALGGGGHARAAGCELPKPLADATEQILQNILEAWFSS